MTRGTVEALPERRFPRPWTVEETCTCFTVLETTGRSWRMFILKISTAAATCQSCSPTTRRDGSRPERLR